MTYLRFDASSLPGMVGTDSSNGSRLSDGRGGYISFGPYFKGDPGTYVAGFYMRRSGEPKDQAIQLDVCRDGTDQLAQRSICHSDLFDDIPTFVYIEFNLPALTPRIEVRLLIDASVALEVQSLVIFTMPSRSWGGM